MQNLLCKGISVNPKSKIQDPNLLFIRGELCLLDQQDNLILLGNEVVYESDSRLVSVHNLVDADQIVMCFFDGDIVVYDLNDGSTEVVGSFPNGIVAASWSPDSELLSLLGGDRMVIVMNRDFYPLNETSFDSTELGKDALIQLGWGKKETQFHGSVGKTAALEKPLTIEQDVFNENDDKKVRISWRGDAEYFCISCPSLDFKHRQIRVYDREGILISVSEVVEKLGHTLSWRPSGNLIASTNAKNQVIFFERNGLRHGEFTLKCNNSETVKEISWNCASSILAVVYNDKVQFYTSSNYYWYLKIQIPFTNFLHFRWDNEDGNKFYVVKAEGIMSFTYDWSYQSSSGNVVCIDGDQLHFTPFNKVNVPPPMSFLQFTATAPINACSVDGDDVVYSDCNHEISLICGSASSKFSVPKKYFIKQLRLKNGKIYALVFNFETFSDELVEIESNIIKVIRSGHRFTNFIVEPRIIVFDGTFSNSDGVLLPFNLKTLNQFEFVDGVLLILAKGKLYVNNQVFLNNASSFSVHENHLIVNTFEHRLVFYERLLKSTEVEFNEDADINLHFKLVEERKVERGSSIVCLLSSGVVLQMPRGNLETIHPRTLIHDKIAKEHKALNYREAFLLCRKHRIDLTKIYPVDIELFVKQVPEVDFLNLYLSNLKVEDSLELEGFYERFRAVLMNENLGKYIEPILTSFAKVGNIESALSFLLMSAKDNRELMEKSLNFLIFLVKVNYLYDIALGMYDFELVYRIARKSQKDPGEYIPFLQHLQAQELYYGRFLIDCHLKRYKKALVNLSMHVKEKKLPMDECLEFIKEHKLYEDAINLFQLDQIQMVYEIYGDYLLSMKDLKNASMVYLQAGNYKASIECSIELGNYEDALSLIYREGFQLEDYINKIIQCLALLGSFKDAAQLALEYLKNPEEAITYLVRGSLFLEAIRVSYAHSRQDLIVSVIEPGYLDAYQKLLEELNETHSKVIRKNERLDIVRQRKTQGREYNEDIEILPDTASMMSHLTQSAMTGYSSKALSTSSKRSGKNRRKDMRSKLRGKEGSLYEEEYLVQTFKAIYEKFQGWNEEAHELIRVFLYNGRTELAVQLRRVSCDLLSLLDLHYDKFFTIPVFKPDLGIEEVIPGPKRVDQSKLQFKYLINH